MHGTQPSQWWETLQDGGLSRQWALEARKIVARLAVERPGTTHAQLLKEATDHIAKEHSRRAETIFVQRASSERGLGLGAALGSSGDRTQQVGSSGTGTLQRACFDVGATQGSGRSTAAIASSPGAGYLRPAYASDTDA